MNGAYDGGLMFTDSIASRTLSIDLFMTEDVFESHSVHWDHEGFRWPLTLGEAVSLRDQLNDLLERADVEGVVQVEILGNEGKSNRTYAYEDPSRELEVDDLVRVPFGHNDTPKIGIVRSHGRDGSYDGPLKRVQAYFHPEVI